MTSPARLLLAVLAAACVWATPAAAAVPTFSVDNQTVNENAGTATFTVTLSENPSTAATVDYQTSDGTAKQPGDYTGSPKTTLTFDSAGPLTQTVSVPINDDALDEDDESFTLDLSNATNSAIDPAHDQGQGTITDNDDPPTVNVDSPTVTEGNSGTSPATFSVSLSAPSGKDITVPYSTADGTATQPGDYTSASDSLLFTAGDSTPKTVSVPVIGDTAVEPDETFNLNLGTVVNAQAGTSGTATIANDDTPPLVNLPPMARIDVNPQRAYVGRIVEFNGSRSSDPDGSIANYSWDLDANGTYETNTGHESAIGLASFSPGPLTAGLRVTDSGGKTDTERASAQIYPAPTPVAPDNTAPRTRLLGVRHGLRTAIRRGLRARLRCSEACLIAGSVGVSRRTGRRLHLYGRNRTMGRAFSATTKAGSKVLTFRLSRRARRALRRERRVRVVLRFKVRDSALNQRVATYRVILHR